MQPKPSADEFNLKIYTIRQAKLTPPSLLLTMGLFLVLSTLTYPHLLKNSTSWYQATPYIKELTIVAVMAYSIIALFTGFYFNKKSKNKQGELIATLSSSGLIVNPTNQLEQQTHISLLDIVDCYLEELCVTKNKLIPTLTISLTDGSIIRLPALSANNSKLEYPQSTAYPNDLELVILLNKLIEQAKNKISDCDLNQTTEDYTKRPYFKLPNELDITSSDSPINKHTLSKRGITIIHTFYPWFKVKGVKLLKIEPDPSSHTTIPASLLQLHIEFNDNTSVLLFNGLPNQPCVLVKSTIVKNMSSLITLNETEKLIDLYSSKQDGIKED